MIYSENIICQQTLGRKKAKPKQGTCTGQCGEGRIIKVTWLSWHTVHLGLTLNNVIIQIYLYLKKTSDKHKHDPVWFTAIIYSGVVGVGNKTMRALLLSTCSVVDFHTRHLKGMSL